MKKPVTTISLVGAFALAACSSGPELEMTQAGYDEARDCFVVLMAMSAVGREQGWGPLEMEKYMGSNEALRATIAIAPEIGISEDQRREDSHADRGRMDDVMAVVRANEDSAQIAQIEADAAKCYEKYGAIF